MQFKNMKKANDYVNLQDINVIRLETNGILPKIVLDEWEKLASIVDSIVKPLKRFGITYFLYTKRLLDGTQFELTNQPACSQHLYLNHYYQIQPFKKINFRYNKKRIFLWSGQPYQKLYIELREYFDVDHGISVILKLQDGKEFFHFAGNKRSHRLINFYINHLDILMRFILYFKDKFSDLINEAKKTRILLPTRIDNNENEETEGTYFDGINIEQFAETMPIDRYFISENSNVYITKREAECLKWYLFGKSSAEIAIILEISRRTAEVHLENVKRKLNVFKQMQLAYKLLDLINLL